MGSINHIVQATLVNIYGYKGNNFICNGLVKNFVHKSDMKK